MAKYRKKPVVITAYRTTQEVPVVTLEGTMIASPGDYIITGVKGERYPCKADIFEMTYEPVVNQDMNFGQALQALRDGQRVARSGWNGKGMWIMLCKPPTPTCVLSDVTEYKRQPYIYMKTAQDTLVPWTASQADILAEDWEVVE